MHADGVSGPASFQNMRYPENLPWLGTRYRLHLRRICVSHLYVCRRGAATLFLAFFATCFIALAVAAPAQDSPGPQPAPLPPPVIAPADTPYPGTISLTVDLTNINDRVLNVHETIPVKAGKITLLYPEWLPGTHSPSNPMANMAGLVVTANGKPRRLGARSREHVRLPHRRAAGRDRAGGELSVSGSDEAASRAASRPSSPT